MKQFTNIIFSCLVFLITLLLFKSILIALGTALGFFLLSLSFEYLHQISESPNFTNSLFSLLTTALFVSVVYILIYLPLEFQITEIWMIAPEISSAINTAFIIFSILVGILVDFQKLFESTLLKGVLIFLVLYSCFTYKEYRQKKLVRGNLPKIYSVNWEWGIQAKIIKIRGTNFISAGKFGKVFLDNQEMLVKLWKESEIVVEQQVPKRFGWVDLYLVRSDDVISNKVPFEIKDPGKIGKEK